MNKVKGFVLMLMVLGFWNCATDNDSSDFHFVTLNITEADLPESFKLNTPYNISIDYEVPDGCTAFDGLSISPEGDFVRNIEAVGTTFTESVCTTATVTGSTTFEFEAKKNGTYVFRFYGNSDNTTTNDAAFLEYTIPVTN